MSFRAALPVQDIAGLYPFASGFLAAVVVIHQLPIRAETLWIRLLVEVRCKIWRSLISWRFPRRISGVVTYSTRQAEYSYDVGVFAALLRVYKISFTVLLSIVPTTERFPLRRFILGKMPNPKGSLGI
jgi:hypothetical protein